MFSNTFRGVVDAMPPAPLLRPREKKPGGGIPRKGFREASAEQESGGEPLIRCRRCLQGVTRPSDRIVRNGAHRHAFANPVGIVFDIGCFRSVQGCGYAGSPTSEFTWFSGYRWRVVYCGMCLSHLGWVFDATGLERFHALILNRLADPDAR